MTPVGHATTSQPPTAGQSEIGQRTQVEADTDERDIPHFGSVITPGVASGPILPEWLRKRFRRKDAPTTRH